MFKVDRLLVATWPHLNRDDIRAPVQTAVAVMIAYVVMVATGLKDVSWAVFSALFVVQATVGGTVGSALERILGALAGAALGVALVLLLGDGDWQTLISLASGVGIMSFIALRWPALNYGLVTVTILVVVPGTYILQDAVDKSIAIIVGSCSAIVAGLLVLPTAAFRSAETQLASAVRGLAQLMQTCVKSMMGDEDGDRATIHATIETALRRARELLWQARLERPPKSHNRLLSLELILDLERFWYSLAIIDRLSHKSLPAPVLERTQTTLEALSNEVMTHLDQVAEGIEACASVPDSQAVRASFDEFQKAVDQALSNRDLGPSDTECLIALKWAWQHAVGHVEAITEKINEVTGYRIG